MKLSNWVRQKVSTVGTGNLLLSDVISSYIRVSSAYANGDQLIYSVVDGINREIGVGTFVASGNYISRDIVLETLVNGAYVNSSATPITLSGSAEVSVMPTKQNTNSHIPVWKTLKPMSIIDPSLGYTPPGISSLVGGVSAPAFDATVEESLGFRFIMPADFARNTQVYPVIHWSPSSVATSRVRWGIEYTLADRGSSNFTTVNTVYLEQDGSGVINAHQAVENTVDAIIAGNADMIIVGRVFRDATNGNDTYPDDAIFHGIELKYVSDLVGLINRTPDFYDWSA